MWNLWFSFYRNVSNDKTQKKVSSKGNIKQLLGYNLVNKNIIIR